MNAAVPLKQADSICLDLKQLQYSTAYFKALDHWDMLQFTVTETLEGNSNVGANGAN